MPQPPKNFRDFDSLLQVVADLRGPQGCPWDREQTHQTLTRFAIEETHELVEAIDHRNKAAIIEELGDVLFQVLLHSEVAKQEGQFTFDDVVEAVTRKMVTRHPHVFGDVQVSSSEEVLQNWHEQKAKEKAARGIMGNFDIPAAMPALLRSQKIGEKTRKLRFDWQNATEVFGKIEEEVAELKEALATGTQEQRESEIGDLLFSAAQLARHLNLDAEHSLRMCNYRFLSRFARMVELAGQRNQKFENLPTEELEKLWREAKRMEKAEASIEKKNSSGTNKDPI